ncbi:hypothetical protein [Sorangium sp. So ce426]|uniref:hypothetical protein n=1 Tax=Sorangium sp. So ce426 TaxID=3133312 RepID=UPI003F5B7E1E
MELLEIFLRAHYHQYELDILGTTRVLELFPPNHPYRVDLSRAFREVLSTTLPSGTLTKLVQNEANRFVVNDAEARSYLKDLYDDLHLDFEEPLDGDG